MVRWSVSRHHHRHCRHRYRRRRRRRRRLCRRRRRCCRYLRHLCRYLPSPRLRSRVWAYDFILRLCYVLFGVCHLDELKDGK